mgnify:FL=1
MHNKMIYEAARERYAALGIDTEKAISTLLATPISMHCWQGDDVRGFEGATALDGGTDGIDFYRIIASRWLPNVNKHGGIIFECDPSQTLEIADMLMPYAMRVKIVTDIFGLQRAVFADMF